MTLESAVSGTWSSADLPCLQGFVLHASSWLPSSILDSLLHAATQLRHLELHCEYKITSTSSLLPMASQIRYIVLWDSCGVVAPDPLIRGFLPACTSLTPLIMDDLKTDIVLFHVKAIPRRIVVLETCDLFLEGRSKPDERLGGLLDEPALSNLRRWRLAWAKTTLVPCPHRLGRGLPRALSSEGDRSPRRAPLLHRRVAISGPCCPDTYPSPHSQTSCHS